MQENTNNIWAEMMKAPKPYRVVPFPKKNPKTDQPWCDVAIVMMTAEESALVTLEAEKKTQRLLKEGGSVGSDGYKDLLQRFMAEGIVYTCVRLADDPNKHFFPRKEDIFKVLTVDEVGTLLNLYYSVQLDLGPIIGELTESEMEGWLRKLTDGGTQARFFLSSFSAAALIDLLMFSVNRQGALLTDSSSPTLPQGSSSLG